MLPVNQGIRTGNCVDQHPGKPCHITTTPGEDNNKEVANRPKDGLSNDVTPGLADTPQETLSNPSVLRFTPLVV